MNNTNLTKYEEIWLNAFCAVASSFNCDRPAANRWADFALDSFKERFPVRKDLNLD